MARLDLGGALENLLSRDLRRKLEEGAPAVVQAPTGTRVTLDYAAEGGPRVEVRVGLAPDAVPAVVDDADPDLVVVAWHQDLAAGRARVVRTLLARAGAPLLLVPAPAVAHPQVRTA